jgi:hypothetical protein
MNKFILTYSMLLFVNLLHVEIFLCIKKRDLIMLDDKNNFGKIFPHRESNPGHLRERQES